MCPPLVASDKSITVVGIFIVSIGFSIAKMSQSYKGNLLLDLLLDPSFRSPHVKNSKTVLHSGFHAVHPGIKVLHSGFFVSGTQVLDSNRYLSCILGFHSREESRNKNGNLLIQKV